MRFMFILCAVGILYFWREPLTGRAEGLFDRARAYVSGQAPQADMEKEPDALGADIEGAKEPGMPVGDMDEAKEPGAPPGGDREEVKEPVGDMDGANESGALPGNAKEAEGGHAPAKEWEYSVAEEGYFERALFIGDSRTVGLADYSGLYDATFYASTGLTIYKLFDAQIVPAEESGEKITIEQALSERQFDSIYLMIGINEIGTGTADTFMEAYSNAVAHLRELQPDAVIYVEAIMRVSTERSNRGDHINNEAIDARNEKIAGLANGRDIFFLDVNPVICDEEGGLIQDYTFDGVHLRAKYIGIWEQFLTEHVVRFT